jgi:tetratricopeptide (TPR) repeat protein
MRIRAALRRSIPPVLLLSIASTAMTLCGAAASVKQDETLEAGRQAYEASDYSRAAQLLQEAAAKTPQNGEIHLLLAKTYYETEQRDAAVASAEKAVAIDPQNSIYHEWLGKTYGEKAEHANMFSAMSLAKKTRKEFERAVELDERNFSARQALIEFDCSAPGIVGGGEEKALPQIEKLAALDVAEGHYAAGNCRRQKKDFAAADVEFTEAIDSHPRSINLIYDIGDYAMKRGQVERLTSVANEGEKLVPSDPRGKFYRAVSLVLANDRSEEPVRLLQEYLKLAPTRDGFPRPWTAHEWLGRFYENLGKTQAAIDEYEAALRSDPRTKNARDALKRLKP